MKASIISRTTQASDIAGVRARPLAPVAPERQANGFGSGLDRLVRSSFTKLLALTLIFGAVPAILYDQFRDAYSENQALLMRGIQEQGRLIVRAIAPLLSQPASGSELPASADVTSLLDRLARDDVIIRVLLKPRSAGNDSFYYFAAAPQVSPSTLAGEREELDRLGVLEQLTPSCEGGIDTAIRYRNTAGRDEIVTSITPLNTPAGCWAVVTSHSTSPYQESAIGRPYWETPEVRVAGAIYALLALATLGLFLGLLRSVNRFARLAREVRVGGGSSPTFKEQNTLPELAGVAEEFDRMVERLRSSARQIRRAAEDNAHAFKTPIAVMRQSLEPLQRSLATDDHRGQRALGMLGMALDRLDGLVTFARHMDETEAALIDPPRSRVNLSTAIEQLLQSYAIVTAGRQIRLHRTIESDVWVLAGEEMIETVVENLVDNALGFTPDGGEIEVSLRRAGRYARLTVADTGPGVPDADQERIFERYFSSRGEAAPGGSPDHNHHMGIGLWIVRRNVEAVGGRVETQNRPQGGFSISIDLPIAG